MRDPVMIRKKRYILVRELKFLRTVSPHSNPFRLEHQTTPDSY